MPKGDADMWRQITQVLSAILVTGLIAWFSFGAGAISIEEYTRDSKDADLNEAGQNLRLRNLESSTAVILNSLKTISENVKEIKGAVNNDR